MAEHTEASLKKLTVAQLKEILTESGDSVAGKKADLITRILENDDGDGSANSADGEAADNVDAAAEEDDIIAAVDDVTDDVADPTEAVDDSAEASASDTTAAKPAGLTDDERRARRAAKFGTATLEDKKALRAKRFGLPVASAGETEKSGNKNGKGSAGKTVAKPAESLSEEELAKLKKRAEKFGVISKHLKTAEDKQAMAQENEKKRKRAEKFGTADAKKTVTPEEDAKKKARAERFGLAKSPAAAPADAAKLAARAKRFGAN